MPMTLVQVIIPSATGIPRNNFVNTFHFRTIGDFVVAEQGEEMLDALVDFYKTPVPILGNTVGQYLSPAVQTAGEWRVKCVDMASPAPQVPYFEGTFVGPSTAGSPLPSECAICLSYKALPESGVNPANRRGRIYVGPLNDTAVESVTGDVRVREEVRLTLLEAGMRLALAGPAPADAHWSGWSFTQQLPWTIEQLWVDDAVDIQRRRGTDARTRSIANRP